jgi:hypothetical protein
MTSLGFNYSPLIKWQGLTFQQVVSTLQKNTNTSTQTTSFFRAGPLKIYRRNIGRTNDSGALISSNNERQSVTIANVMEQPGGAVNTTVPICYNNGVGIVTNQNITNNAYQKGLCTTICVSEPANALKRVKSAGMIRSKKYNVNSYQYLDNRDRTFAQNQFNYIKSGNQTVKPGSALAILANNQYVQNGNGQFNVPNNVVIYKPNNAKYGQQGGVSSSARIDRLKLETIQTVALQYKNTFGTNSQDYKATVTYGGSYSTQNGTTFGPKDNYNVPTPQITRVDFT